MTKRENTKRITAGGVPIGGGAAVSVQSMCNVHTQDLPAVTAQIRALRAAGCDVVIALTHNADPLGFARQTKGVDAVIAGHEHVVMEEAVAGAGGTAVAVVEVGHYLQYAGVLDLTLSYDDNGTETVEDDVWSVTGNETDHKFTFIYRKSKFFLQFNLIFKHLLTEIIF